MSEAFAIFVVTKQSKNMTNLSNPTEVWKPIKGYECCYEISNKGSIKSLRYNRTNKAKILVTTINNHGYRRVVLFNETSKNNQCVVHRLVALNFVDNPDNKPHVNHIDGNKLNNNAENLEWVTHQENIKHAVSLKIHLFGERHGASVLNQFQVKEIKEIYATGTIGTRPLAKQFGVSRGCVTGILRGKNWKHL